MEICKQQSENEIREMEICKQQSEIEMRNLPDISIYGYVTVDRFMRYGRLSGRCKFFF